MKRIATLCAAIVLAACTTVGGAPAQSYRAVGESDMWSISASAIKTPNKFSYSAAYDIQILIDGQPVLSGKLDDAVLDMTATHRGKRVEASCVKVSRVDFWSPGGKIENARCTVFVNNERAATLTIDA